MKRLHVFIAILFSYFSAAAQVKDTITITGVGDIMMGSNYPNGGNLPPDNGKQLMKAVSSILTSSNVTFGNLEGTLLDQGGIAKTCRDPKLCYAFRSPESYVQNLVDAGFDVMSVANNHAGDFGWEGKQKTEKTLETAGIYFAGQSTKPSVIFKKDGITFGFAAFAPNTGCASIIDLNAAKKIVSRLDSLCDIVIVSFHGGAEGPQQEHVTRKTEVFYSENRGNVYEFAHKVIDAGADIVFGHGPHVTRAVELYKDRFIAYSLGNFCTYGGINVTGVLGLAPIIRVYTDAKGNFFKAKVFSTNQQLLSPVTIDAQKQALKRIQQLSREDFPEKTTFIDDDGWVKKTLR
ncbi:metallophosphatase [Cytophagales bacterium WSM2-2]|nr:metallophosphatase [Cytophagales bacterium WSM2-2]